MIRSCIWGVVALWLCSCVSSLVPELDVTPAGDEDEVELLVRDYVREAKAGQIGPERFAEGVRPYFDAELMQQQVAELQALGELHSLKLLDEDLQAETRTYYWRGWFDASEANIIVQLTASGELENFQCVALQANRMDSPRMQQLAENYENRGSVAVEEFWQEVEGHCPLVEEIPDYPEYLWVTYLFRDEERQAHRVALFGGLSISETYKFLHPLAGTDVWYRTEPTPRDARFGYAFAVDPPTTTPLTMQEAMRMYEVVQPRTDKLNPNRFFIYSVMELPDAPPQPWVERHPGVPEGKLEAFAIDSEILGQQRSLTVYTPPGYETGIATECSLAVIFDGETYGGGPPEATAIPGPTILDNLITAGHLQPTIAVLLPNQSQDDRGEMLGCSLSYARFLAEELVPWLRERYRLSDDPAQAVVAGSSLGGTMAAFTCLHHSDVFGNVLSQSGAFWAGPDWDEGPMIPGGYSTGPGYLIEEFCKYPKLPLKFYLDVGRMESIARMLAPNRHMADVLRLKGYPVTFVEFNGGHDYLTWRQTLADGLLHLLGKPPLRGP